MKRLSNTMETRHLPTFGDYRRMRMPEPFSTPTAKEQEILKKAAETAERTAPETAVPVIEDETIDE